MLPERVPGKVQAIGILHLVGGILNILAIGFWALYGGLVTIGSFGLGFFMCCPVVILVPIAILELISGIKHLSSNHAGLGPPRATGIAEIFSILACTPISLVFGILTLVFLSDPEVEQYYARKQIGQ